MTVVLRCPHCSNTTPHEQRFWDRVPERLYDSSGSFCEGQNQSCDYEVFQCSTCRGLSLYSRFEFDEDRGLVWPRATLDRSVPKSVANNYDEAKKVQNLSPNSFAVMIRRAVEALCDDRAVPKGNLAFRLKTLAEKGEIPSKLADVTAVLRQLGNAGAHHSEELKVTVPMTWALDDFFRAVVEYVYVAPSQLERFQKEMAGALKKKGSESNPPDEIPF